MKDSIRKVVYVVLIVFGWDSATFIHNAYMGKVEEQEKEKLSILEENEKLKEVIVSNDTMYKESLQNIVESVYLADSFLNEGGKTETLDYDVEDFFHSMYNENEELNSFLESAENYFSYRLEYYNDIPDIWPLKEHLLNRITSPFGPRFDPFGERIIGEHRGIDLASIWKAEIIATADGIIIDHWIYHEEFGRCIRIEHENGFITFYGHLAKTFVHEGDFVKKGEVIGLMGNSGKATGAHLHYEIIKNGVKVNPVNYLRKQIGKEEEKYVYEIQ